MTCTECNERSCPAGYEQCKHCLVQMVRDNPAELECFFDQQQITQWMEEAMPIPQLTRRQAS